MAIITAGVRIRKAHSSRVPRNADLVIEVGDLVRVFRENDKRYVGPYPVIRVDGTHMFIIDKHREVKFNKHLVLPATTYDKIVSGELLVTTLNLRCRNYGPIVYANPLPLTAQRSQASSSRRFYITMILECEVSKLIEHESKK